MNKRPFPMTNIGSVSLLMIFIVLCMVTLSALSLSSAAADQNSALRLAAHNREYYEASAEAEVRLAKLQRVLSSLLADSTDLSEYAARIGTACEDGTLPDGMTLAESEGEGLPVLQFEIAMNERQSLHVELELIAPEEAGADDSAETALWRVLAWQEISTADWNADNSLTLIQ